MEGDKPEPSKLESECPRCEGKGGRKEYGEYVRCYECDDTGYLLTDAGREIWEMVFHQVWPLIRDAHRAFNRE